MKIVLTLCPPQHAEINKENILLVLVKNARGRRRVAYILIDLFQLPHVLNNIFL